MRSSTVQLFIICTALGLTVASARAQRPEVEKDTVRLPATVISATRGERRIEDEPLRVELLDEEEVEEKLLMTPGDITMMLNETAGLRVQITSPSLGGANVRVQGLRGRYTQILADGLPLYGGQTGGLGLLQIPPMDLGGVEIVKGAASALHGGSAMGGVINLISRRPGEDPMAEMLVNQTTLGGTDVVGFAAGETGERWGYTLLAGAHRQSVRDVDRDGWADVPGHERLVVRPRAFWSSPAGHTLMLTAGTTLEAREGGTLGGRLAPDAEPHVERLGTTRADAGGVGRWLLGGMLLSTRGSIAMQRHTHDIGDVRERDRHLTWFGEAALSLARGTTQWVIGSALQQERYHARDVSGFDYSHTTPAVFAQVTIDLGERVAITASGRADRHEEYGTQLAPRISALFRAGGPWTVRLSGGGGYYAPTPFTEETEVIGLTPLDPLHGIRAERARSGSVDLGGTLGGVEVNATVFASEIRHPVALAEVVGSPGRVHLLNVGGPTRTRGGELLARIAPEPFHLSASWTYTVATEQHVTSGLRGAVALTPRHQAGVVAAWEEEGTARVGVELYYTGVQILEMNPYRQRSVPYKHVGVLAEHRIGRARVYINAENLLGERLTRHHPLVLPQRGPGGRWTTDAWAPLDGRVANAGVRLDLR